MAEDDTPAGQPPVGEPGNVDATDNSARFADEQSAEAAADVPAAVPAEADVAAASPKAEPGDPEAVDTADAPDASAGGDEAPATEAEAQPEAEPAAAVAAEPALEGKADAVAEPAADEAAADLASASAEDAPAHQPETNAPLATEEPEPEPEPEPEREPDPVRDPLLEVLQAELGADVLGAEVAGGDLWVRVAPSAWKRAAELCRDRLGMDYFCFLSGMDWLPNPNLSAEKIWDPDETVSPLATPEQYETGAAGGETRFQVFARVYSTKKHVGITLKADLDEASPTVGTWREVYRGADWHERETWEMYGFHFEGHDDLRHMYLPGEFEGFPLRKDFPLLAREVKPWPGLVDVEPMPGEDEETADAAAEGGE